MDFDALVYADRSDRTKLRFTGEQRLWFLDQILTQRFEDMAPGETRDACMITVHGRMTAFLEAVATADAVLVHAEPGVAGSLSEAISAYVFATRVEIADVTSGYGLVLVAGPGADGAAAAAGPESIAHPTASLGTAAAYAWVPAGGAGTAIEALEAAGARRAAEDELEAVRIANGVPRWGADMDARTFPQEAGIDDRAVHYDKGCYLGQEAMAKIHFRGRVNRRRVRLVGDGDLSSGAEIVVDGGRAGSVTSAHGAAAIALVKHTVAPGTRVVAGGVGAVVVD